MTDDPGGEDTPRKTRSSRDPRRPRRPPGTGPRHVRTLRAMRPPLPEVLGRRFAPLEILGEGAQGCSLKARDLHTGQHVVVKLVQISTGEARDRFERECHLLAHVPAGAAPAYMEHGVAGDQAYIVYAFEAGATLESILDSGVPLGWRTGALLLREIASVLAAIHAEGIVHRDVKPFNILVTPGGVRLLDFGFGLDDTGARLTSTGLVVGTPAFVSPEQLAGDAGGPASDLYALGVIGHRMITGVNPFVGDSVPDTIRRHLSLPIQNVPGLDRGLYWQRVLADLLLGLVAKSPSDRPPRASRVVKTLDRVLGKRHAGELAEILALPPPGRRR